MNLKNGILAFIANLAGRLRPAGGQPPVAAQGGQAAPVTHAGQGQASQDPQKWLTNSYHFHPMVNGQVPARVERVRKQGGTLTVDVAEYRVPTANGTVVDPKDIEMICEVCGQPSEEELYCDTCSRPLCVRDIACVDVPDTGETLHLCPNCCTRLYAEWNTWRGHLKRPYSIKKTARSQGGKP
jgi:hypothetical protein